MTIRKRLTLWYVLVSLIIFILSDLGLFFGMRELLYQALDDDLERFVSQVESRHNPLRTTFTDILLRLKADKDFDELYIVAYDTGPKPIFSSPLTSYFNLNIPFTQDNLQQGYIIQSVPLKNIPYLSPERASKVTFRAISRKTYHEGRFSGWIHAALPIITINEELDQLLRVIFIINIIAIFLMAVGGYIFTAKVLSPIKKIIRQTDHITHSNLEDRLPVKNPHDELGKLALTLNDLFERLQKAFSSQKEFLSDATHELKTPIATLRARMEELLYRPDLPEPIAAKLSKDVETLSRMNQIISNLLFLSRTESIDEVLVFNPVSLDTLLKELVEELQILSSAKNQTLQFRSTEPIELLADRQRLYQLFFNMIENSIKYTQNGGHLIVSLNKESMARISVADDGPGIAVHHLPNLFKRFYRIDKTRSRKKGGSGLGLAICKFIAEGHGGSITVASEPGKGTTFIVELPILKRENDTL